MRMKYFFVRINLKSLEISLKSRFKSNFDAQDASKLSCFVRFIQHLACVFGSLKRWNIGRFGLKYNPA